MRSSYIRDFLSTEAGQTLLALVALGIFLWVMFKCAVIAWRAFGGGPDDENLPHWVRVAEQTEHMSFRWTYENSAKGKRDSRRRAAGNNSFDETQPIDAYSEDKALEANLAALDLKAPATFSEIKARYRQLVLKNHPDVLTQSDDPEADGRMAEINRAFDWLEDRYAVKS
jgi:DnaJ domain